MRQHQQVVVPHSSTLCTPAMGPAHLPQAPVLARCACMQLPQYSRCPQGSAAAVRRSFLHTMHSTSRRALLQAQLQKGTQTLSPLGKDSMEVSHN